MTPLFNVLVARRYSADLMGTLQHVERELTSPSPPRHAQPTPTDQIEDLRLGPPAVARPTVRAVTFSFFVQLFEKYGTSIERNTAL
eukprot:SAG31_NODE_155_length_22130_cov_9.540098_21_plen_86_part_00